MVVTMEDLKAVRAQRRRVERLKERIQELREQQQNVTQRITGLPKGENRNDSLAEFAAKLDELEIKLMKEVICLEEMMERIDAEINALPVQKAEILRLRYFDGLKWQDVAERMNYCESHCKHINKILTNITHKL